MGWERRGCMQQEEGPGTLLLPALALTTPCTLIYPLFFFAKLSLPLSLLSPLSARSHSPQKLTSFTSSPLLLALPCTPRSILSRSRVCTASASPTMVPLPNLLSQGPLQPAGALPCVESPIWKAESRAPCAGPARPPLSGSGFN